MKTTFLILIASFYSAFLFGQNCNLTDPCYPVPDGLIGWWSGDNSANDMAGTHNGTLMNGATFAPGEVCSGFMLDGVNDYISINDDPLWAFGSNDFSIDLWAEFFSFRNGLYWEPVNTLIASDERDFIYNKWIFHSNGNSLGFIISGPSVGNFFMNVPWVPLVNTWYHLAVVRAGNLFSFYVNGALLGTRPCNIPIPDPATNLTLGWSENVTYFHGILDEVDIFNRALSANEIYAIYSAGCAGKCKGIVYNPAITPSGPISICNGSSVTLTASEGASYLWSTGATTSSIEVYTPGDYSVIITYASGCSYETSAVTVTLYSTPVVSAGDDITITLGQSATLTATASGGTSPYYFLWSTGAGTQSITVAPSITITYVVTGTDANNCSATDAVTVTVIQCSGFPCGNNNVQICHIPPGNPGNAKTQCVSINAVPAHLAHGDYCGPCLKDATAYNPETPLITRFDVAPNPFTDKTNFNFSVEESTQLKIDVYDMFGHQISTLFNGEVVSGKEYNIEINSKNLPKGIYLYRAVTPGNVYSGKMLVQ